MKYAGYMLVLAGLALAGCERKPEPAPSPTATATAAPAPTVAATDAAGGLSRYVGKYPFDKVGATSFMTDPLVAKAVRESGADTRIQELILGAAGPQTPIRKIGDKIVSWGCETHNCGPHNWTLAVREDGTGGEVCYFEQDDAVDVVSGKSIWFSGGKKLERTEACPAGE